MTNIFRDSALAYYDKKDGPKTEYRVICNKCEKEFVVIERAKLFPTKKKYFCSRSCANSRVWNEEINTKRAITFKNTMKTLLEENPELYKIKTDTSHLKKPRIKRICVACSQEFEVLPSNKKKTCSKECYKKIIGGIRKGSGCGKSGYYKGFYCASRYELAWLIYAIDNNLEFKEFDGCLSDGDIKYYPDFLLPNNLIIEIKGYYTPNVDKKTKIAKDYGYDVSVLYKENLQHCFDWIKEKYGVAGNIEVLYDGYKPKYEYICDFCKCIFFSDRKIKTKTKFCGRSCAGKNAYAIGRMKKKSHLNNMSSPPLSILS